MHVLYGAGFRLISTYLLASSRWRTTGKFQLWTATFVCASFSPLFGVGLGRKAENPRLVVYQSTATITRTRERSPARHRNQRRVRSKARERLHSQQPQSPQQSEVDQYRLDTHHGSAAPMPNLGPREWSLLNAFWGNETERVREADRRAGREDSQG